MTPRSNLCSTKLTEPNCIDINRESWHGHHYILPRVIASLICSLNVKQCDEPVGFHGSFEAILPVGVPRSSQDPHDNAPSRSMIEGPLSDLGSVTHRVGRQQCTDLMTDKEAH